MIKRKFINVLMILMLAFAGGPLYAQKDTATHSLDEYQNTDSDEVITDTLIKHKEKEEDADGDAVDTLASFNERFSIKQQDSLSSLRSFPPGEMQKIKSDDDFWYANAQLKKKEEQQEIASEGNSFWEKFFSFFANENVRTVLWILMILVLLSTFVIYLSNNKIALFGSSGKNILSSEEGEKLPDNIFEIDFDLYVNNALKEGDYRMATRLLFLRMLKTMSQKNLLQYSFDKTNMDYLFELNGTKYFRDFATASRNYEYVWYGNFSITQEQFGNMKDSFEKFN